jgi:protease PrsW
VIVQPELVLIAVAAVLPPLALAVLAWRLLPRPDRSRLAALVAFGWGALVAAWVAQEANGLAARWTPLATGDDVARMLVPTLVAPLVEELVKAAGVVAALLVARRRTGDPRAMATAHAGAAAGALVGLGFAACENVGYYTLAAVQAGWDGLARAVFLRGVVQAGNHALFTAIAGAALAASRRAGAPWRAVGGVALAWALHALWNAVLSDRITAMLCNAPAAGAACAPAPDAFDLFVGVPLLEAAFLLPSLFALRALVRRA